MASEMVINFVPATELQGQRSRTIEENTVIAMFMINRAAEALAGGATDDAYWWVREALQRDPRLPAAYNALDVVYLRRGLQQRAKVVLDEALRLDPGNTPALANLVQALQRLGLTDGAAAATAWLARHEPYPPFHWSNAGLEAMREHDYSKARELFTRELGREPDYHDFHFWLAQAEARLGNLARARKPLELAAQTSTTERDYALYAGKLDRLRALAGPPSAELTRNWHGHPACRTPARPRGRGKCCS
jgi:Tfp pilus assembly protein PilF